MGLTHAEVEQQEFSAAFRGYEREEVDRFLDLVAVSLAELTRERDALARRVEEMEGELADTAGVEHLLKRALVDAQRSANQTVAEARREAEEILALARREADSQRALARAQAAGVRQVVDELHRFRSHYREQIQAVVQRAGELPPLPQALETVADRALAAAPPPDDHAGEPAVAAQDSAVEAVEAAVAVPGPSVGDAAGAVPGPPVGDAYRGAAST